MNDLTVLSDNDLERELDLQRQREEALSTEEGVSAVRVRIMEIIKVLEDNGYVIKGDRKSIAKIWTHRLKDQIVRIGYSGVQEAVLNWIENDDSQYMTFPKVAWIEQACRGLKGDPRVEKGRREYAREVARLEAEHRQEMENWKKDHPREWEEVERRTKEYELKHNRDDEDLSPRE